MNNVVDFGAGRARSQRLSKRETEGARILFFTGVRYERISDDDLPPFVPESEDFQDPHGVPDAAALSSAFELATR